MLREEDGGLFFVGRILGQQSSITILDDLDDIGISRHQFSS